MNTEKEKTSSEEQKKAEKVLKDKVPVQQTGTYSEATKKEAVSYTHLTLPTIYSV